MNIMRAAHARTHATSPGDMAAVTPSTVEMMSVPRGSIWTEPSWPLYNAPYVTLTMLDFQKCVVLRKCGVRMVAGGRGVAGVNVREGGKGGKDMSTFLM